MPELPDIEGYRRYLARHAQGRRIVRVEALDPEIIRNRRAQEEFASVTAPLGPDAATLDRVRRDRLYGALADRVRDDRNGLCPRCGSRLRHDTIAGRTACWCPHCQRQ